MIPFQRWRLDFGGNVIDIFPQGSIDKSALYDRMMFWRPAVNKPLPEPMIMLHNIYQIVYGIMVGAFLIMVKISWVY